jgi:preprotein translocase subunit SecG
MIEESGTQGRDVELTGFTTNEPQQRQYEPVKSNIVQKITLFMVVFFFIILIIIMAVASATYDKVEVLGKI